MRDTEKTENEREIIYEYEVLLVLHSLRIIVVKCLYCNYYLNVFIGF